MKSVGRLEKKAYVLVPPYDEFSPKIYDKIWPKFDLAFGQDLLPKPGTNQKIGIPNICIISNHNQNATGLPLPQSPLAPFLK